MKVVNLILGRQELQIIEELFFLDKHNILTCTNRLIEIIYKFPGLSADSLSSNNFSRLTAGIYSMKSKLPEEKQKIITDLFWTVQGFNTDNIHEVLEDEGPVKNLLKQQNYKNAVFIADQDYPIPLSLIENEEMPSKKYLKTLLLELGDGPTVKISQGLLWYFSDMVKAMIGREEMIECQKLILEQVSRDQFDSMLAFLLTKEAALIHEENVLSLMYAASFFQISEVIEVCKKYIFAHSNDLSQFHMLNVLQGKKHKEVISQLERRISEILVVGLQENPVTPDFLAKLEELKEILNCSICVNLSRASITDEALKLLIGLPINELQILSCNQLTKRSFDYIKQMPSIKILKVGGCDWIDDDALSQVPASIEEVSLANCSGFTRQGLVNLQNSNVRRLDLFSCKHLRDDDFTSLSNKLEVLHLRMCKGIGKNAMEHIGKMTALQDLVVASTPVNDEYLAYISKDLIGLDLSGCPITSRGLSLIKEMRNMRNLSLSGLKIKDDDLALLPESLVHLRLDRCTALTNDGIIPFSKREKLKYLGLWSCSRITQAAINEFASAQIKVGWKGPQSSHLTQ